MKSIIGFVLVLLSFGVQAQACTTTVSTPASNVVSAFSAAATGDVICLNSGSYGTVDLFDTTKGGYVTIRSVTGVGASGFWRVGNTQFLRLASVTGGIQLNSCSKNIYIYKTVGTPNSGEGIYIDGQACPTTVQNIVVDSVVLDRIGQTGYEGRLSIRDGNTVTVKHSQFLGVWESTPSGPSDGIIMVGGIRNITIGPGNYFSDINQTVCNANGGAHCDMIQTFGGPCTNVKIEGNAFKDSSTFILNESECSGTFKNNVMINITSGQWHTWNPLDWSHNTVYNSAVNINESATFTNSVTLNNNIWHSSTFSPGGAFPCSVCTLTYNVFTSGCQGTDCITGTPTYSGGSPPPTTTSAGWQGWRLSVGSVGKGNASDSKDRGTNYFKPAAPGNIR